MNLYDDLFPIGELARRTGVGVSTLRAWERRYGFPVPQRLPGGHRRYRETDVLAIRDAVRDRQAGRSLPEALAAASERVAIPRWSIAAALQRALPDVPRVVVARRTLVAVSHAIEDEVATSGDRAVLLGSFQRPERYAGSALRWRDLARTCDVAVAVGAAHTDGARSQGALWEVPAPVGSPVEREWAVICDAPGIAAALVAVELPAAGGRRRFEAVWTSEPAAVREAARAAAAIATDATAELGALLQRLGTPAEPGRRTWRATTRLANRIVGYVDAAVRT